MNTYILAVACVSMFLSVLSALIVPLVIGRERGPWTYASFVSALLEAVAVVSMGLYIVHHA